ncbi:MAG TPA: EamA family transporter [Oculatellaceae cyanobacterium]
MLKTCLKPQLMRLVFAFAAVYIIWGSTYLGIKVALESMPPFFMVGVRFLIAGLVMYGWTRIKGTPKPEPAHLLSTLILGVLLLGFGTTGVVLAERSLATGLVSLLVAMVPLFIVLFDWLRPSGKAPEMPVILGVLLGICGLAFLLGPNKFMSGGTDIGAVMCVVVGSMGSAAGALYSRSAKLPSSQLQTAGLEMLFAGIVLLLISFCAGEFSLVQHTHFSERSLWALAYLVVFGSMVAFSAYVWLLKQVHPSQVATYAYVNPVVAVLLGWSMAGESITVQTVIGAGIILSSVWLITQSPRKLVIKIDPGKTMKVKAAVSKRKEEALT